MTHGKNVNFGSFDNFWSRRSQCRQVESTEGVLRESYIMPGQSWNEGVYFHRQKIVESRKKMYCRTGAIMGHNALFQKMKSDKVIRSLSRDMVSSHIRLGKGLFSCSNFCFADHDKQMGIDGAVNSMESCLSSIKISDSLSNWKDRFRN